jgi:membrane associated rhomboid family serine protease
MMTAVFAHSPGSILHIGLNMYSLYVLGPPLERLLGRGRFIVLFLVSGFGGSVAVLLLMSPSDYVLGASGAIFGLAGAFLVLARKLGGNTTTLVILIGINLVVGFVPGTGIAWEAHIGGLVVGAALAAILLRTRRRDQRTPQIVLIVALVAALIVLTLARL